MPYKHHLACFSSAYEDGEISVQTDDPNFRRKNYMGYELCNDRAQNLL